jgi:hypothetical protein
MVDTAYCAVFPAIAPCFQSRRADWAQLSGPMGLG